ncbi:hypothetical protein CISG_07902 [Coccidioides immitis RMSCC 3703]|uniref:Uncharacterized protein n=1 Tax=Coccidioides immitis RMSCC 3703 TaxID=454286 RepID=A0A0J8R409_COCIT|nr:hypothetical protein CISG_07902 [Coccidioides immitis RMSCC 3703]
MPLIVIILPLLAAADNRTVLCTFRIPFQRGGSFPLLSILKLQISGFSVAEEIIIVIIIIFRTRGVGHVNDGICQSIILAALCGGIRIVYFPVIDHPGLSRTLFEDLSREAGRCCETRNAKSTSPIFETGIARKHPPCVVQPLIPKQIDESLWKPDYVNVK